MPDRLLVLDTASLYFRAFHGVPATLTAPDGRPVNAVRGLLDIIARFVTDRSPTHLVCAWDNDWRPPWRVALLPSYKAHRLSEGRHSDVVGAGGRGALSGQAEEVPDGLEPQIPLIRDVLDALGIAVIGVDGYEADDVIGTLAAHGPSDVVTGDRDLFQVASDEVTVLYVARGISKYESVTPVSVEEKYGVRPDQYVDFAVLRGDPSDGLPGVPGVGERTAADLLRRFGDLEGILAHVDTLGGAVAGRLAAAVDYLAAAQEVVRVRSDLVLDVSGTLMPRSPADPERFATLTDKLGLGGSAQRVLAALAR